MTHHFDPADLLPEDLTGIIDMTGIADGDILEWDSTSGLFLPVAGGGGGGSSDLTFIGTVTPSSGSITLGSIPGTHRDLLLVGQFRSDRVNATDSLAIQVGNTTVDTGANYDWFAMVHGTNASNSDGQGDGQGFIDPVGVGGSATSGYFSTFEATIFEYADSSVHRRIQSSSRSPASGTVYNTCNSLSVWRNTADVLDTIKLFSGSANNLVAGSYVSLYGRG